MTAYARARADRRAISGKWLSISGVKCEYSKLIIYKDIFREK